MSDDSPIADRWSVEVDEPRADSVIRRLGFGSEDAASFVVWVHDREGGPEPYEIQLTTIGQTDDRVRQDYRVETYGSADEALDAAEEFATIVESHVREGRIAKDDPSVETVDEVIDEFTGVSTWTRIRRFLAGVGQ